MERRFQVCVLKMEAQSSNGYARKGDTFILACPVDGCDLGG